MELIQILQTYKQGFFDGLLITLQLCILIWVIGISIGSLLGVLGAKYKFIGKISYIVSTIVSGVPVIVMMYWLYYPMQQEFQIDIPAFKIAVIGLSIVNILIVSELVKNAINELPRQFLLAAKVCGLNDFLILTKIQIPLISKQLLGPILLVQITMLHNSIFASLINVDDIFRQIQRINAIVYKPIELYSALALFFILISVPLSLFGY